MPSPDKAHYRENMDALDLWRHLGKDHVFKRLPPPVRTNRERLESLHRFDHHRGADHDHSR